MKCKTRTKFFFKYPKYINHQFIDQKLKDNINCCRMNLIPIIIYHLKPNYITARAISSIFNLITSLMSKKCIVKQNKISEYPNLNSS